MGKKARSGFLLCVVLLLAACTSKDKDQVAVNPNLFPMSYKKEVADTMRQILGERTRVTEAAISDPVLAPVDKDQRFTACVRVTAPGAGKQGDRIAYFFGGHLNLLIEVTGTECAKAVYKPFPEMLAAKAAQ